MSECPSRGLVCEHFDRVAGTMQCRHFSFDELVFLEGRGHRLCDDFPPRQVWMSERLFGYLIAANELDFMEAYLHPDTREAWVGLPTSDVADAVRMRCIRECNTMKDEAGVVRWSECWAPQMEAVVRHDVVTRIDQSCLADGETLVAHTVEERYDADCGALGPRGDGTRETCQRNVYRVSVPVWSATRVAKHEAPLVFSRASVPTASELCAWNQTTDDGTVRRFTGAVRCQRRVQIRGRTFSVGDVVTRHVDRRASSLTSRPRGPRGFPGAQDARKSF